MAWKGDEDIWGRQYITYNDDTSSSNTSSSTATVVSTEPSPSWMIATASSFIVVFALLEFTIVMLTWRRKHTFPLNALPILWHVFGHLSFIVGMFANFLDTIFTPDKRCWVYFVLHVLSPFAMGSIVAQFFYIWFSSYLQHLSVMKLQSKWIKKSNQITFSVYVFLFIILSSWMASSPTIHAYVTMTYDRSTCKSVNAAISSLGPVIAVVCIIIGAFKLRKVKEAFNLKQQYKNFALVLIVMTILGTALSMIIKTLGTFPKQAIVSIGFFGYPIFCGIYPLKMSYLDEQRKARAAIESSRRVSMASMSLRASQRISPSSVGRPAKNMAELRYLLSQRSDLVEGLIAYTVREFCVENALFIRSLNDFRREPKASARLDKAAAIGRTYIVVGTSSELNISMNLRTQMLGVLTSLTEAQATVTLFEPIENEILQMLIDPFNRYLIADAIVLSTEDYSGADAAAAAGPRRGSTLSMTGVSLTNIPGPRTSITMQGQVVPVDHS